MTKEEIHRQFALERVKECGYLLKYYPEFCDDEEIVVQAMIHDDFASGLEKLVVSLASPRLKKNKKFGLIAVKINGYSLYHLSYDLTNDPDVVTAAVSEDPSSFKFASLDLRQNLTFVKELMLIDPKVADFATKEVCQTLKKEAKIASRR